MKYQYNGGFVPANVSEQPFATPPGSTMDDPAAVHPIYYEFLESRKNTRQALQHQSPYYEFFDSPIASSFIVGGRKPYYEFASHPGDDDVCRAEVMTGFPDPSRHDLARRPKAQLGRPIKVIHAGPHLCRGGAEQWLIDLAKSLDPKEVEIVRHVAVNPKHVDPDYVADLTGCGITVEAGGAESLNNAAEEADVLLSWGLELRQYLTKRPRAVSVQVVHGDGPWNRRFLERSGHCIDHAVAVSHRVQRLICADVPSTVIYNGIDAGRIVSKHSRTEVRNSFGICENDFVVGFFGRLATEKRISTIIDAVALLPENVKVIFVGRGPLENDLRQRADEQIPGRARFTAADGNLGDLYSAVDAVCLASNQEGFSLVMLEAMLSGKPVLSTPVGSACEVIEDRISGLLHDGSPSGIASVLDKLVRFSTWRAAVAAEGRSRAEQFGYSDRMARDYTHLLTQLLDPIRQSRAS